MKKLFAIAFLAFLSVASFAQSTSPRFSMTPPADNTGRSLTFESYTPTLAATDSIAPKASVTFYKPATLAEAKTIIVKVKKSYKNDRITFIFTSDGTGRVVTFSTGFTPYTTTLNLIASKQATASFIFDGVSYVEEHRSIQQ